MRRYCRWLRAKIWFQVFYANTQQTTLNWDIIRHEFAKHLMEEKPLKTQTETNFDFITTKGTDITLEKARHYAKRLGVSLDSTPDGEVFINGKPVEMNGVGCIPSERRCI
jgi:UDP-glucose:glycoprotein glucosyltransferase